MVVALAQVPTEEREPVLIMAVALALVPVEEIGLSLIMAVVVVLVIIEERGLAMIQLVAPAGVHIEVKEVTGPFLITAAVTVQVLDGERRLCLTIRTDPV